MHIRPYIYGVVGMAGLCIAVALPMNVGALLPEESIAANISPFSALPNADPAFYRDIFAAQKRSDWASADALINKLTDQTLLGHILAERYTDPHYHATAEELSNWLKNYADHPQAYEIYTLAAAKAPTLVRMLPQVRKPYALQGYGDDNGLARASDAAFAASWQRGLSAWKKGEKADAARIFANLAESGKSRWQQSAAAYWTYRSLSATGSQSEAYRYLRQAADASHSFYGILARRRLKEELDLDDSPLALSDTDRLALMEEPAVSRSILLVHAGRSDLAEQEMRALYPQTDEKEREQLLALSHELHLASTELSMARSLSHTGPAFDLALYPIPSWKPRDGFTLDPALIYALARQESGFHSSAVSPDGAVGIMQLMPKTAELMQKSLGIAPTKSSVSEPSLNLALGQNYVQRLLSDPSVNDNLIYMLSAYNAGPGRLQEWKEKIDAKNDPLLFLESIPYSQTRYYVMQVMANYWVYSELAGTPSNSVHTLLQGQWPSYEGYTAASQAINNHSG